MASQYVYGNLALKPETITERPYRYEEERTRRQQSQKRAKAKTKSARRAREEALSIDAPYVVMFSIALVVSLFFVWNYLHLKSSITSSIKTIETQEKMIEQLKSENDALESSIDSYVDLQYVFNVATNELGMVYADNDQIIRYNKTENGYVRQNEDIVR